MLKEKLDQDLKAAMRAGDRSRVSIIRLVRAGIKYAEVAKGATLDESGVISVIMKEIREHRDSLAEFKKANRTDLTKKNEEELEILLEYLPQQMSREEIAAAAQEVIAQIGARGTADKGKVMPVLMAQLRGKADGRDVNEVVSDLLAKIS